MTEGAGLEPEIGIVVSNWNGIEFLGECVSSLWESALAAGRPFELIVVDDVSGDGSAEMIERNFPGVRLLRNARNMGFARTCNRGARAARADVLVMMNNDMRVPLDFIETLTRPFFEQEPSAPSGELFCVGARTVDWHDGRPNHLCMDAAWRRGGIGAEWTDPREPVETAFAQGGSAAFRRDLFLDLGGFDPVFHPTYWDDYDLCYRACREGLRVLYEPRAVADHLGKATLTRQHRRRRLTRVVERNRVWTTWLNLSAPALWLRHILSIPWVYGRDLASTEGRDRFLGFLEALSHVERITRVRRARRRRHAGLGRGDLDILGLRHAFDRSGGRIAGMPSSQGRPG